MSNRRKRLEQELAEATWELDELQGECYALEDRIQELEEELEALEEDFPTSFDAHFARLNSNLTSSDPAQLLIFQ